MEPLDVNKSVNKNEASKKTPLNIWLRHRDINNNVILKHGICSAQSSTWVVST